MILLLLVSSYLNVGEALFEGNKISLSGDIVWEHPIGTVMAKSLDGTLSSDRRLPQELVMQEGVKILFHEGGELSSPYAWIGCRQCLGIFHGHEGEKIAYNDKKISLKSLKMEVNFLPPKMLLEKITAEDEVEIALESGLQLTGDRAIFDHFSPKGTFGRASLQGDICRLKQEKNEVRADTIVLDLDQSEAVLYAPKGVLYRAETPFHFTAKEMHIDKSEEKMELAPPVRIEGIGILESLGHAVVMQKENELHRVFIDGFTKLHWGDRHLTVHGALTIDAPSKTIQMTSPGTEQVHFTDPYGEIFSDQMLLTYNEEKKPIKILLEGNVRLQNNTPGALQYALADEATFEFEKNTLTLKAKERRRALFYDELNKVQASAPGLTVNRDPKNGQNIIRGQGNVRFIFAEDELQELKKRFSFEY